MVSPFASFHSLPCSTPRGWVAFTRSTAPSEIRLRLHNEGVGGACSRCLSLFLENGLAPVRSAAAEPIPRQDARGGGGQQEGAEAGAVDDAVLDGLSKIGASCRTVRHF